MRAFRLFVALAALALLAAPARALDGPAETVKALYALVAKSLGPNARPIVVWRPPYRERFLSAKLAKLFARDDRYMDKTGDVGHLDYDPFINGQDGEVKQLVVAETAREGGKATVVAKFRSFDKPLTIAFPMVLEKGGWRIDDILGQAEEGEGKRESVSAILSQPYDCDPDARNSCKKR